MYSAHDTVVFHYSVLYMSNAHPITLFIYYVPDGRVQVDEGGIVQVDDEDAVFLSGIDNIVRYHTSGSRYRGWKTLETWCVPVYHMCAGGFEGYFIVCNDNVERRKIGCGPNTAIDWWLVLYVPCTKPGMLFAC